VARAEVYLHAKFHLDPSNRLAAVHQRYRHRTDRQRSDSIRRSVLQTVAQNTYKVFQLALFWSKLCKNSCFFTQTTVLSKEGNSKNRTKIRSYCIWQIYVSLLGARSRLHASGPGVIMIRPCVCGGNAALCHFGHIIIIRPHRSTIRRCDLLLQTDGAARFCRSVCRCI